MVFKLLKANDFQTFWPYDNRDLPKSTRASLMKVIGNHENEKQKIKVVHLLFYCFSYSIKPLHVTKYIIG